MKILFINQFDLFEKNSAAITVRDLFGDSICKKMPRVNIEGNKVYIEDEKCTEEYSFDYSEWNRIIRVLKKFKADIIYTTASASKILALLIYLKYRTRTPVLMHYFDNWREIGHVNMKNGLLKLLGGSHERALVISDEMNNYYSKRYHGNYTTLMIGTIKQGEKRHADHYTNRVKRIMYAGGLHLGRAQALSEVEKIINSTFDCVKLVIATFSQGEGYNKYHELFDETKTEFLLDVCHSDMEAYYDKADALLFIETAPEDQLNYLRYSMSTKIPEYLSSGIPILCYAKPGIASYEYFKRTSTALLASTTEEVKKYITEITSTSFPEMVARAKKAAHNDFDHESQQKKLLNVMDEIIEQYKHSK